MSNFDTKAFEAEMRAAPRQVRNTCTISLVLATVLAVRFFILTPATAQKSAFFLALIFFNFVFNGVAILARSKLSYMLLAFFSSLSLLGAINTILELIGLLVHGEGEHNSTNVAIVASGLMVTGVIALLFYYLFAKETRDWVWKPTSVASESNATT